MEHPTAQTREPAPQQDHRTLDTVLAKMQNPQWDVLLVGDGSGSGWDGACGWAATLITNQPIPIRRFFYGAMDCGSVNFAESMPYIQALTWYDNQHGKERLRTRGHLQVHVLTDSQTIATWGNRAMGPTQDVPRKQFAIWAAMKELRRNGYHCQFHWAPRQTTELNWAADLIAGLSRGAIMRANDPAEVEGDNHATRAANAIDNLRFYDPETGQPLDPHALNPQSNV